MADVEAARRALVEALGRGRGPVRSARPHALRARRLARRRSLRARRVPAFGADIAACLRIAAEHGLPVVPRGSGTGLAGGATPIGDALVVVTSKMTRILEVRPEDRLAWVEPGLPNLDLANALRPYGFTYAPDPSSQQTSLDRRQREHERRRPPLSRLRRHVEPRPRARRRARRRHGRAPRLRGARSRRLRPPRRRGRQRGNARDRRAACASGSPRCRRRSGRCCSTSPPSRTAPQRSRDDHRRAASFPPRWR